jgi:hypothetical protein
MENTRVFSLLIIWFNLSDTMVQLLARPDCRHLKCGSCEDNMPSRPEFEGVADQQASHEWDVQSLASVNTFHDSALGSSLPSNTSGSITQGLPKTAQDEIVLILFSDQKFRSLLESAASMISKPRFTRNIRRLLLPSSRSFRTRLQTTERRML